MTPKQVLAMIKEKGVVMVDVKFIDLLGTWQHFTAPISEFKDEAPFDEGLGFDGCRSAASRHSGNRHAPDARPGHGDHRSVQRAPTLC